MNELIHRETPSPNFNERADDVSTVVLPYTGMPRAQDALDGLCHGTAGNGYALLRTFERTDDERWLERARAFAVHALEQAESLPARYTLFTGGLGVALFAADCIDAQARVAGP